jgi:hypothetical protein
MEYLVHDRRTGSGVRVPLVELQPDFTSKIFAELAAEQSGLASRE